MATFYTKTSSHIVEHVVYDCDGFGSTIHHIINKIVLGRQHATMGYSDSNYRATQTISWQFDGLAAVGAAIGAQAQAGGAASATSATEHGASAEEKKT